MIRNPWQPKDLFHQHEMDEYTADAFANRDEPLPVLTITPEPGNGSQESDNSSRAKIRKTLSASRLKERIQDAGSGAPGRSDGHQSLQDRLFSKYATSLVHQDTLIAI